jgi:anti-anti-sigma factor
MPDFESDPLRITVEAVDGSRLVRAVGEIDMATAEALRDALAAARQSARATALDMSGVTFIDSTGLHLLIETSLEAAESGYRLSIVEPSKPVLRLIALTGTAEILPLTADSQAGGS